MSGGTSLMTNIEVYPLTAAPFGVPKGWFASGNLPTWRFFPDQL